MRWLFSIVRENWLWNGLHSLLWRAYAYFWKNGYGTVSISLTRLECRQCLIFILFYCFMLLLSRIYVYWLTSWDASLSLSSDVSQKWHGPVWHYLFIIHCRRNVVLPSSYPFWFSRSSIWSILKVITSTLVHAPFYMRITYIYVYVCNVWSG